MKTACRSCALPVTWRRCRLNAPRVIDGDIDDGFLLLSDLGTRLYLDELKQQPVDSTTLYADAINALLTMQRRGVAYQSALPPYDEALLRFELSLFKDWLCGRHLELSFSAADDVAWRELV